MFSKFRCSPAVRKFLLEDSPVLPSLLLCVFFFFFGWGFWAFLLGFCAFFFVLVWVCDVLGGMSSLKRLEVNESYYEGDKFPFLGVFFVFE